VIALQVLMGVSKSSPVHALKRKQKPLTIINLRI